MNIGIIGAGWYGSHLAIALKKAGHEVTLFEKNDDIFSQISGNFGIRLHTGPHYPRSQETRKYCRKGFDEFKKTYPDLISPHIYSIYALGATDANGEASKVNLEQFKLVCDEVPNCREVDLEKSDYQNLLGAFNIDEPSIAVGDRLRETFRRYLSDVGVKIICNYMVKHINQTEAKMQISNGDSSDEFDKIINATSYQSFLPNGSDFPFDMEVTYQPCLALLYRDTQPNEKPISFIVMDGWFPCLMPYQQNIHKDGSYDDTYIMTHGKWTIMGSYQSPGMAQAVLEELSDDFVSEKIKRSSEGEMNRFWPTFNERFIYLGWKGTVLAKLRTKKEFRSAVTFECNGVIHIIPGKINNIFDAEREVMSLLDQANICSITGYQFVKGGVLDTSIHEIIEKPVPGEKNTCALQTYSELKKPVESIFSRKKSVINPDSFWATQPKDHGTSVAEDQILTLPLVTT